MAMYVETVYKNGQIIETNTPFGRAYTLIPPKQTQKQPISPSRTPSPTAQCNTPMGWEKPNLPCVWGKR